ncbi:MAG: DUF362 domain-containing protein [Roseburia sp.]|nr:DUF362 domain-containing protein [Roseburia sp.]MCM1201648.1 DUF362 domain-containing protein [Bacteroides fragilis]
MQKQPQCNEKSANNYFMYLEDSEYPEHAPYDPEIKYPEYCFEFNSDNRMKRNDIYRMIREIFIADNMDYENINTDKWNPLGTYISPGSTVLIKPNLVMSSNNAEKDVQKQMDCLITHPSIVRCLFDYVCIALKGKGKVIVADAPVQDCDFDKLLERSGYGELFCYLKKRETPDFMVDIADLRDTILCSDNGNLIQCRNKNNKYGSIVVDLKEASCFQEIKNKKRLRVTNYAAKDTVEHHSRGKNEYCISEVVLDADVIINIPKPKTHRIAGYTAALKNMIGINVKKEFLPHHRQGMKKNGGDEYADGHKILKYMNTQGNDVKNWALKNRYIFIMNMANEFSRRIGRILDHKEQNRKKFGMWYGNDTIWRTILDVNHIVYYFGKDRMMHKEKQRTVLHFGDMIVCGDKEGPLHPGYKKVGGILFSDNPVEFDFCVVKLMGFDYKKFPVLANALNDKKLSGHNPGNIILNSNREEFNKKVSSISTNFEFEPSKGWNDYL